MKQSYLITIFLLIIISGCGDFASKRGEAQKYREIRAG